MWWQFKSLRRLGAMVMALSIVVATVVATGMYRAFSNG
jgi:hypothetical protein